MYAIYHTEKKMFLKSLGSKRFTSNLQDESCWFGTKKEAHIEIQSYTLSRPKLRPLLMIAKIKMMLPRF